MEHEILYSGMSICLINCFINRNKMSMTYGFGYFTSNLPENILLKDGNGNHVAIAKLDPEITNSSVMSCMGDANGDINELKLTKIF